MSSKYNVRLFPALLLALVTALVLVVGCALSQSGFSDSSAEAKSHEKTTGESTRGTAKADDDTRGISPMVDGNFTKLTTDDVSPEDVACVPESGAKEAKSHGVEVPKPTDKMPVQEIEEPPGEEGAEEASSEEPPTHEEFVKEAASTLGASQEEQDQLASQIQKAIDEGATPVCATDAPSDGSDVPVGDIKINAPGDPLDGKVLKADAETVKAAEDAGMRPPEKDKSLLGSIDTALFPDAQAQAACSKISLVKQSTSADLNTVISVASALNKHMIQHFSVDWNSQCSSVNEIVSGYLGGIPTAGNWPVYLASGQIPNTCSGDLAAHQYGQWPYYPYTTAPYGWVGDVHSCNGGSYGVGSQSWSRAISHEIVEVANNPYKTYYQTRSASYVGYSGNADYMYETADPVNPDSYGHSWTANSDGRNWLASDYVLYSWFNPGWASPWDESGKWYSASHVPGPLQMYWDSPLSNKIMFWSPYYPYCLDNGNDCKYPY